MHPPTFHITDRLSDWPDCRLELHCSSGSGRSVDLPVKLLLSKSGDRTFGAAVGSLRCRCCGKPPAPVYLVAGLMRCKGMGGPPPCWAVELVGERRI